MEKTYYRGDTFVFPFSMENENKEKINFEVGDIVKFGAKEGIYRNEISLYKEIEIETETSEIQIKFSPEETKSLKLTTYIIELELTRNGDVETIYQGQILIKGDVINAESNT